MIAIKSTCLKCSCDWSLPPEKITIHTNTGSAQMYYSYECPSCNEISGAIAEPRFSDFLKKEGGKFNSELFAPEILEPKIGLPISYDDILDLHLKLKDNPSVPLLLEEASQSNKVE